MLEQEAQFVAEAIARAIQEMGHPLPAKIPLLPIPFAGQWGVGTPVAKSIGKKDPALTEAVAQGIADRLRALGRFAQVYAERGFVNCIFDINRLATAVVRAALAGGADYGRGVPVPGRVMIEYAQMNTHKELHIGHLRNVALGAALVRIMRCAGYDVVAASYPGDSGLHVAKCLWCYTAFHAGEEPPDPAQRGRWLGERYVEGNARLTFRADVRKFIERLVRENNAFTAATDGMMRALSQQGMHSADVAQLMAVLTQGKPFDPMVFKSEASIPAFWAYIGQELRHQRRRGSAWQAHAAPGAAGGAPEPPSDDDLWTEYRRLDAHFRDWWGPSAAWEAEMRALYQRLEAKEPATMALWERTRRWSLDELTATFARLGAPIDVYFFESEMEEPGRAIVRALLEQGIAEISAGLPVVKIDEKLGLAKETYRVLPVLRSDGTTLYSTKDLALAQIKFEQYGITRSIYVVDSQQSLHFQ